MVAKKAKLFQKKTGPKRYFNRLFYSYSIAFLAFFTVSFIGILIYFYKMQYNNNVEVRTQMATKVNDEMDASLKRMDQIINGLLLNKEFMAIMEKPDMTPENNAKMWNYFLTLDAPNLSTYSIMAFNNANYFTLTKGSENQNYVKEAISRYPYKYELANSHGQKVILPVHQDPFTEDKTLVYSVARQIIINNGSYGTVEVQNKYQDIVDAADLKGVAGKVMIVNADGQLVYPVGKLSKTQKETYATIKKKKTPTASFRKGATQITYNTSAYSGWTSVILTPMTEIVPFGVEMIIVSLLLFLLLSITVLLSFRALTKRMVAPLSELNEGLHDVSLDKLSLRLQKNYGVEEIDEINQSFQKMFDKLQQAINMTIHSKMNEERANFLALQSQMNPHTIYNTISMIESVAYMNEDYEVSELCIRFSKMLRYISDFNKEDYTVADEVEHLKNYSVLIEKRYEGKISINIQVDPGLEEKPLVKFTLQPLVENSVKYGMRSGNPNFTVDVMICGTKDAWQIRVVDNGSGFSKLALDKINNQLDFYAEQMQEGADFARTQIGNLALINIYMRNKLLYKDNFSMTFGNNGGKPGAFIGLYFKREEGPHD